MRTSERQLPPWLRPTADGVEVQLFVQPRASRDQLTGVQGGELKVRLTAPPVDGAANAACCALLARLCRRPKSSVSVTAGAASRHKRVLLAGADPGAVADALLPVIPPGVDGVDLPTASD